MGTDERGEENGFPLDPCNPCDPWFLRLPLSSADHPDLRKSTSIGGNLRANRRGLFENLFGRGEADNPVVSGSLCGGGWCG